MALKEKIPCPRCDAKGILPRYYYNKKGICFLCWGEKYIYVKIPKGQDKDAFIEQMKKDEKDHLDNHPPKVAMPDKMRNDAFDDDEERKAFGGGGKEGKSGDPKPVGHTLKDEEKASIDEQLSKRQIPTLEKTIQAIEAEIKRGGDEKRLDHLNYSLSKAKEILQAKLDKKAKPRGKAKPNPTEPSVYEQRRALIARLSEMTDEDLDELVKRTLKTLNEDYKKTADRMPEGKRKQLELLTDVGGSILRQRENARKPKPVLKKPDEVEKPKPQRGGKALPESELPTIADLRDIMVEYKLKSVREARAYQARMKLSPQEEEELKKSIAEDSDADLKALIEDAEKRKEDPYSTVRQKDMARVFEEEANRILAERSKPKQTVADETAEKFPLSGALARAGIREDNPEQAYADAVRQFGMDVEARAIHRIQDRANTMARRNGGSAKLWAARLMAQTAQAKPYSPEGKKSFDSMMRLTKDEVADKAKELEKDLKYANAVVNTEKKAKFPEASEIAKAERNRDAVQVELDEARHILGLRAEEDMESNRVADFKEPSNMTYRSEVITEYTGPEGTRKLLKEFQESAKGYTDYEAFKIAQIRTDGDVWKERLLMTRLAAANRITGIDDYEGFFREIGGQKPDVSGGSTDINEDVATFVKIGARSEVQARRIGKEFMKDLEASKPESVKKVEQKLQDALDRKDAYRDRLLEEDEKMGKMKADGEAEQAMNHRRDFYLPLLRDMQALDKEIRQLKKEAVKANGIHRMDRLKKYREFGGTQLAWTGSPTKRVKDLAQQGTDFIPKDWLDTAVRRKPIATSRSRKDRAFFGTAGPAEHRLSRAEIHLPTNSDIFVSSHELMHYMEWTHESLREMEKEFYERRTAGTRGIKDDGGVFHDGNFLNRYIGKRYGDEAFEVLSVGIQMVMGDERYPDLHGDPDYAEFIYGTLLGGAK